MAAIKVLLFCLFGFAIANEVAKTSTSKKEGDFGGYFTDEWRKEFSNKQLSRQAKWNLTDDQPQVSSDGSRPYQVREYAPSWFVTSFTPCLDQTRATTYGYLKLYFYMNRYNYDYARYPLTYPIITKVERNATEELHKPNDGRRGRKVRPCSSDRFSVSLALSHEVGNDDIYDNPARTDDESILLSEVRDSTRRFVLTYDDLHNEASINNCNVQAGKLAAVLRSPSHNRAIDRDTYYCAVYKPGRSGKTRFEVWFDDMA